MSDTLANTLREAHENLCAALATAEERGAMEEALDIQDQLDDLEGQFDDEIGHGSSILDYSDQTGPTEADL